ncbi:hypothetical protein MW887_011639 [Aspergillus wentii]|nr:hypothetical protein MW887_011639 [Aspergillus wentii]
MTKTWYVFFPNITIQNHATYKNHELLDQMLIELREKNIIIETTQNPAHAALWVLPVKTPVDVESEADVIFYASDCVRNVQKSGDEKWFLLKKAALGISPLFKYQHIQHPYLNGRRQRTPLPSNNQPLHRQSPGYGYFKHDIEFGNPTITLIDFPERGYGRLRESLSWHPHISPSDLHHQLTADSESISTRYILVQDLTPCLCLRVGAIFDIDPQFFLDHANNQVNGSVRRSSRLANAAHKRKQIERQDRVTVENRTTGDVYKRIWVTIVRSELNILRSELDLSVVSTAELAAVEERVSVYQIERD